MNNIRDIVRNIAATNMDDKLLEMYSQKTCAVVGSSGGLLDHEYGALIDEHDIIIRCNQAVTEGYEKHVGSRTDIRVLNSHYFTALKKNGFTSHAKEQFPLFNENLLYQLENELLIVKHGAEKNSYIKEVQMLEEKNRVLFLSPEFYQMAGGLINSHATNGFIGIFLAIKYFSNVSCFGFTFCKEMESPDWANLYYFMPAIPPKNWKQTNCHSNDKEAIVVSEMVKRGTVKLYEC